MTERGKIRMTENMEYGERERERERLNKPERMRGTKRERGR